MNITEYLKEQIALHPSYTAQDAVKQCFQASFGADHLLSDVTAARAYFRKEYASAGISDGPLIENISADTARVNLGAWKKTGMDPEWLFQLFVRSVSGTGSAEKGAADPDEKKRLQEEHFISALSDARALRPDFAPFIDAYLKEGIRAVHHSDVYREAEKPEYRIVRRAYARLIPVLQKIAASELGDYDDSADLPPYIIALDGPASSGKSTAADVLSDLIDASVIHMDDFFLPPELRTEERFRTPGGNVHSERFIEEILPNLKHPDPFYYQRFDCSVMDMGPMVYVDDVPYRIVEGSYSELPAFGPYADLKVFLTVSPEEQEDRILKRNGPEMLERFRHEWIPLENAYFEHFQIKEKADVII